MMHEDGVKNDLQIKQLKEQSEILNECHNECEAEPAEILQNLADAYDQIEKSMQYWFNNMQIKYQFPHMQFE